MSSPRRVEVKKTFNDNSSESAPTFNSNQANQMGRLKISRPKKETIVMMDKMKDK